jgi:putative spermidine/putrescine transport system permease protein
VASLSLLALWQGVVSSLQARRGAGLSLDAYRSVLGDGRLWPSLALSVWVAAASTVLACSGAALVSFGWLGRPGRHRRIELTAFHLTLGLPHLVWAVALVAVLGQSGWLARLAAWAGLIERPAQFPVLVNDAHGVGIVVHLVTKELPFVVLALVPLAGSGLDAQLRQAATLGASPWARFRHVFLPSVAPALVPAAVAVFAFGLGGYEPGAVLGVQRPRTLAVVIVDRFRDPDLTRRAEAFVLSGVLVAVTVGFGLLLWAALGRSLRVARAPGSAS